MNTSHSSFPIKGTNLTPELGSHFSESTPFARPSFIAAHRQTLAGSQVRVGANLWVSFCSEKSCDAFAFSERPGVNEKMREHGAGHSPYFD